MTMESKSKSSTERLTRRLFVIAMVVILWYINMERQNHAIAKSGRQLQQLQQSVPTFDVIHPLPSTSPKKAMLCTVIKDPQKRYIDEWADYHMALGFDRLALYDNTEEFVLEDWGWEKSYATKVHRIHFLLNVTHIITHPSDCIGCGADFQSAAFMDCAYGAKANGYDYVAGLDIDEFLVIRKNTSLSIVDLMEEYCQFPCGQLGFNWIIFGPSHRETYVPVPVTKRFNEKIHVTDWDVLLKSIANTQAIDLSSFWMHSWNMLPGYQRWDTNGKEIKHKPLQHWRMMMNYDKPTNVAVIHHYKTLSEGEWHEKNCKRKDINNYDLSTHCNIKAAEVVPVERGGSSIDESAWEALRRMVPSYQVYDSLEEKDLG
mmetsp:Transcript_37300/g.78666  ORF Transcript_37300/g.78666 Transcript_37300/m.78666 type:complete len:373 (+) Transcript_37300:288-1406(+)